MLTVSEDSEDLTECMRLGARGFLLKNIHADFLVDAIRKAAEGDNVFSPEMTARLVQSLIQPNTPPGCQRVGFTDSTGVGNPRLLSCWTQQQNYCTQTQSGGVHHQSACTEYFTQT